MSKNKHKSNSASDIPRIIFKVRYPGFRDLLYRYMDPCEPLDEDTVEGILEEVDEELLASFKVKQVIHLGFDEASDLIVEAAEDLKLFLREVELIRTYEAQAQEAVFSAYARKHLGEHVPW